MDVSIDNYRTLASTSSAEYADIDSANKFNENLHDQSFHIGMNLNEYEHPDILYNNCQKFVTPFKSRNLNYAYQFFVLILMICGISFFVVYLITGFDKNSLRYLLFDLWHFIFCSLSHHWIR